MGERQGQRVPPSGPVGSMPPNVGAGVGVGMGGRPDAQAMLVQQNREMEALERRSQRERSSSMNPAQVRRVARKTCNVWSDPFVFRTETTAATAAARRRGLGGGARAYIDSDPRPDALQAKPRTYERGFHIRFPWSVFTSISERPCSAPFHRAAFSLICTVAGNKQPPKPSAPYSIFDEAELKNRAVRVIPPFLTRV